MHAQGFMTQTSMGHHRLTSRCKSRRLVFRGRGGICAHTHRLRRSGLFPRISLLPYLRLYWERNPHFFGQTCTEMSVFCLCVLQGGNSLEAEADALYDDVLSGSMDGESTLGKQESKEDVKPVLECVGGKRFSVYIGNFNWVSFLLCCDLEVCPLYGCIFQMFLLEFGLLL